MKTKKHPRDLTDAEASEIVELFDAVADKEYSVVQSDVLAELRAAAATRREAEGRLEAAALAAYRQGLSWGVIGSQLGITRQGARQRFEQLTVQR